MENYTIINFLLGEGFYRCLQSVNTFYLLHFLDKQKLLIRRYLNLLDVFIKNFIKSQYHLVMNVVVHRK